MKNSRNATAHTATKKAVCTVGHTEGCHTLTEVQAYALTWRNCKSSQRKNNKCHENYRKFRKHLSNSNYSRMYLPILHYTSGNGNGSPHSSRYKKAVTDSRIPHNVCIPLSDMACCFATSATLWIKKCTLVYWQWQQQKPPCRHYQSGRRNCTIQGSFIDMRTADKLQFY